MSKFKVGDKAIIVVSELASGYRDDHGAEYDPGKVVTIVEEVDDEGDCYVKSDESVWNCCIAEKNLKPLETGAGSKYKVGDKVRILKAEWADGAKSGWNTDHGHVGIIENGRDKDGDYGVAHEDESVSCFGYIGEGNLAPFEEPARTSVGTAILDIQVRFMIGDVDVTDKLKGLVAAEVAA